MGSQDLGRRAVGVGEGRGRVEGVWGVLWENEKNVSAAGTILFTFQYNSIQNSFNRYAKYRFLYRTRV